MADVLRDLIVLYRDALTQTIQSLRRGWVVIVAIYVYAAALVAVGLIARAIPVPLLAGLLVGLTDACVVGALLALIERALGGRTVRIRDATEVVGTYFWDVVAVGFVLWPKSPRFIDLEGVGRLVRSLPDTVMPVGVFVRPSRDEIESAAGAGIRH